MAHHRVALTAEKETLLVPLWSKAVEARRAAPLLEDPWARKVLEEIDYDFASLRIPPKTALMLVLRAKKLDEVARRFLAERPDAVVVHLGCGLDARSERVPHPSGTWHDVDYPEVIDLRRRFFEESPHTRMVATSVTGAGWLDEVAAPDRPALAIAEGLVMYLSGEQVRALVLGLEERFAGARLAFDAYSTRTARRVSRHPSLAKTGAVIDWGLDDPGEVCAWGQGIRLVEEWAFSDAPDLQRLDLGTRLLFGAAGLFQAGRRAHRVLVYDLGRPTSSR